MASLADGSEAAPAYDQFASLGIPKSRSKDAGGKDATGSRCEMKTHEVRYNSRGEIITLEAGMRPYGLDRSVDDAYAFSLTRFYNRSHDLEKRNLESDLHMSRKLYSRSSFDILDRISFKGGNYG